MAGHAGIVPFRFESSWGTGVWVREREPERRTAKHAVEKGKFWYLSDMTGSGMKVGEIEGRLAPLIVIVGPTATGKSALAMKIALEVGGEIINCDSMQLYRKVNIGTAKPSARERSRLPHHLYDVVPPQEFYSAGRYMAEARSLCREIASRGRVPVVVGGTGLYLNALIYGIFDGPGKCEPLRRRLQEVRQRRGTPFLHRMLVRFDPASADQLSIRDRVRIVRALEVYLLSGEPMSRIKARRKSLGGFRILRIGLNFERSLLYDRINRRVEDMFERGLVQEVRNLLEAGLPLDSKCFEAIGYRHVAAFIQHELTLAEAIELTRRDTRRYAKRQLTWFRRDGEIQWISKPGEDPRAFTESMILVRRLFPSLDGSGERIGGSMLR